MISEVRRVEIFFLYSNDLFKFCLTDSGVDSEIDDASASDERISRLFKSSKIGSKSSSSFNLEPTKLSLISTPIPSADLAPLPKKEEIFGNNFFHSIISNHY